MRSFQDYHDQLPDRLKADPDLIAQLRHAWHAGFSQRERDFVADDLQQVAAHKAKTAEWQREIDARICEDNGNDYLASAIRHAELAVPDNTQTGGGNVPTDPGKPTA